MTLDFGMGNENSVSYNYGAINGAGICMSIAGHWVRRCLRANHKIDANDPIWQRLMSGAGPAVAYIANHGKYDQTGGNALIVSAATLRQQAEAWHRTFFDTLSVTITAVHWGIVRTIAESVRIVDASPGGGFIYSIYGTTNVPQFGLTGGHTIAFWKGRRQKVYFHPNK